MTITIRPMREADLGAVDHVMRLAFGTFLGMPDPLQFMGDTAFARTRWKADPSAAFCAQDGDRIVGSVFVGNWGSVGFFGPLTIHPDHWNGGVAQLLMRQVMDCFERWGTRHVDVGGGSAAGSGGLGEGAAEDVTWTKFSDVPLEEREGMLGRCRALTGKVLEGLDVGVEIRSVAEQRRLLAACEQLAAERGLEKVSGGVNTARQEAWAAMLDSGWRGTMAGVAMQGLEEPGYNRPGVFLVDDWR